ncbi:MAG: MFS transporter, partial [Gemmatimonadetes bacterium]|nr:MFS transporter [Gemmatimonadota bacterium]
DLPGGLLFAAALALLTIGLARTAQPGIAFLWFILAALAATALAVYRQATAADPLLPRTLLRAWDFRHANLAHLLVGAALIIGMVTVPLMADTVLYASPLEGGLRLLRMTIAISAGALVGGILTQRLGARPPALAGLALTGAGFLLMSRWGLDIAEPWMTVHLAVTGLGFGLLIAPITESALHSSRAEDRGAGSALLTVSRMMGMTIGLAALTAWGSSRFQLLAGGLTFSLDPAAQAAFEEGAVEAALTVFRGFFAAAAGVAFAILIPALLMTRRPGTRLPPQR